MCICIPFSYLRRFTEISACILSILGLFAIIFGGVLLGKNKKVTSDSANLIAASYGIMLGLGFILLLVGALGLLAWKKRNNCLLGIYILCISIVVACSAIVFGVSAGAYQIVLDSEDDTNCQKKDFLIYSRKVYEKAQTVFCQKSCMCQVKQSYLNPNTISAWNWSETQGKVKSQDCPTFSQSIDFTIPSDLGNLSDLTSLLGYVESSFNCSGFCSKQPIYYFSNSYKGQPTKDCKVELLNFLDTSLVTLANGGLAVLIISIIGCVCSCSLICHKHKREGNPYYDDYEAPPIKNNKYR
ncbi:hypothetical protein ABPG74_020414 [Tetrahymena malaccensis]